MSNGFRAGSTVRRCKGRVGVGAGALRACGGGIRMLVNDVEQGAACAALQVVVRVLSPLGVEFMARVRRLGDADGSALQV